MYDIRVNLFRKNKITEQDFLKIKTAPKNYG